MSFVVPFVTTLPVNISRVFRCEIFLVRFVAFSLWLSYFYRIFFVWFVVVPRCDLLLQPFMTCCVSLWFVVIVFPVNISHVSRYDFLCFIVIRCDSVSCEYLSCFSIWLFLFRFVTALMWFVATALPVNIFRVICCCVSLWLLVTVLIVNTSHAFSWVRFLRISHMTCCVFLWQRFLWIYLMWLVVVSHCDLLQLFVTALLCEYLSITLLW